MMSNVARCTRHEIVSKMDPWAFGIGGRLEVHFNKCGRVSLRPATITREDGCETMSIITECTNIHHPYFFGAEYSIVLSRCLSRGVLVFSLQLLPDLGVSYYASSLE